MAETEITRARRVALVRTANMRELGGLPVADGRRVRRRLIFRAGGLHHLESDDLARVRQLRLRTLVDLRTRGERESHGVAATALAGTQVHLPMIPDVWDLRPLGETEPIEEYFAERYREMLELGHEAITRTLAFLLDPERLPLGFFCAAGKDRTGVMTAVLLRLLGASDATIIGDYVLSGAEVAQLISEVGDRERWTTARMGADGQVPRLLTAPAPVMARFLGELPPREDLANELAVSADDLVTLRDRLLEAGGAA